METTVRTRPPGHLLQALDEDVRDAVLQGDDVAAADAMLDVVEGLPPFSSRVLLRSAWLREARQCVVRLGESCPDPLEVRMLASIARTAFAARETTAGLAASEHALGRAIETGNAMAQIGIVAGRLPFLAMASPVEAARDARMLESAAARLNSDGGPPQREADVLLAQAAWSGATGDGQRVRKALISLGRLALPRDEALVFVAYASQAALAQLYLRARQRGQAALALIEAARLANDQHAYAELANLQTVIAAIAMMAGDFQSAVAHARSAVEAAGQSTCQHAQPDPWLGFPIDICLIDSPGGAVQALAESALSAQDLGDAAGFEIAATAMAAFYLADDRALEALDALTEAAEVARSLDDGSVATAIRGVAEALLSHLGILRR